MVSAHGEATHSYSGEKALLTLESLLGIEALDLNSTLNQASDLVGETMHADKIDIFLLDPETSTLIAEGTSHTPMAELQKALGLDRLPLANGGREVEVFQTGEPYISGHVDLDTGALPGFRYELGALSMIMVPLDVSGQRRGLIQVASATSEAFTSPDLRFMQSVARWVGLVIHRAELLDRTTKDGAEQARAVAANELVTVLAHDLRNQLTPLVSRVQLLRRRASREGREADIKDIDEVSHAVGRLSALINDLLDTERLEEGLFSVHLESADLVALLQETTDAMQTEEAPVHLLAPDEMIVPVDAMRIRQAIENLLSNAIKHSLDGAPVLVELYREQQGNGEYVVVTVRDRGSGVPKEIVPKLFSRFSAGPGSSGLGLGLYLARSIVQAHGGTLDLDGSYTCGAGFRLALPLMEAS